MSAILSVAVASNILATFASAVVHNNIKRIYGNLSASSFGSEFMSDMSESQTDVCFPHYTSMGCLYTFIVRLYQREKLTRV